MSGTQDSPQKLPLKNDQIAIIPLMGLSESNQMVPLPQGRTPTAVSSDPSQLNAVIDGMNCRLNALVPLASNITVELDDGSLNSFFLLVDIVEDLDPTSVVPNLVAMTFESQPRPTVATPTPAPTPDPTPTPTPEPTPTPAPVDTSGDTTTPVTPVPAPAPTSTDTGTVTAPGVDGSPTPGPADTTQPPAPTV
jgi:hypothetical protein